MVSSVIKCPKKTNLVFLYKNYIYYEIDNSIIYI